MDRLGEVVGRLLSELHAAFTVAVCPGDWAWTTTMAGALFALLPMLGAMAAALLRRSTGNRYGVGPVLAFLTIGLTMSAVLPWIAFQGTSHVFRAARSGVGLGLSGADLNSLGTRFCFAPSQAEYLGDARTVREVVASLSGSRPAVFIGGLALLALVPLLCLLFVLAQARLAFRRGPKWPARLLWLPLLAPILGTAAMSATVAAHLWLGFLPASVLGLLGVALVGAPRWGVIERRAAAAGAAALPPPPAPPPPARFPGPGGGPFGGPAGGVPAGGGHGGPGGLASRPVSGPQPTRVAAMGPPQIGARPGGQPPGRRTPTAALGVPEPPPVPASGRALAADPGPLPESLQRALGLAGPTTPVGPPEPPTLPASRFRRIRPLGTGGFGTVWLAMDTALDRTVAVKAAKAPDAETERRIRREARALAAVRHPHCVRVYDILTDSDGELAIIMEYVPGRSLTAEIEATGPLPDAAAARLWGTLAGALHAAHATGVLHRDVKPSNIIIDEDGYPHLIDFGIARATGDVTLTATGMVLGTPDFMAPEAAAGQPASPASDAWQLAATVSYALTGRPPRGHRDGAVAAMLAAAQGEPCNQLPTSSVHRMLLEQALHPDPMRRPGLTVIQAELGRWLSATGQQADGPVTQRLVRPREAPAAAPAWPTEEVP